MTYPDSTPLTRRMLMATEGLCVIALAIAVSVMPGAPRVATVLALTLIGAVAIAVYRRQSWRCLAGEFILAVAVTGLGILTIADVHSFTVLAGGTDSAPVLVNFDLDRNMTHAVEIYRHPSTLWLNSYSHQLYYGLYALVFALVGGPSVTAITIFTLCATVAVIVLTGALAARFSNLLSASDDSAVKARNGMICATVAMGLAGCTCQFAGMGTVPLKDSFVTLSVALMAMAMLPWRSQSVWLALAAIVIAMIFRSNYAAILSTGLMFALFAQWRRHELGRTWAPIVLCIVFALVIVLTFHLNSYAPNPVGQFRGEELETVETANQSIYFSIMGRDLYDSPWLRILALPISAPLQLLIPLPFTAMQHAEYGPSFVWGHFGFVWYLIWGCAAYMLFRRVTYRNVAAGAVALWGFAVWVAPCVITSGIVSRYAVHSLVILAPLAAYALVRLRGARSFRIWLGVYGAGIVTAMAAAWVIMSHYTVS